MMALLATIVVLGVLIFVHELGHFWAAKLVNIEVQRFSIGLGPRLWGFTRGETEYVVSAIPLGGYVKMGGMDDEVMDRIEGGDDGRARTPSPRDFDAKPIWARAFVLSAGVIMNMIFAFVGYAVVAAGWGIAEIDTTRLGNVDAGLLPPGAEVLAELPIGARLTRINDQEVTNWGEVRDGFLRAGGETVTVETESPSMIVSVDVPVDEVSRNRLAFSLDYWLEAEVRAVEPGAPAARAGIRPGDRVFAVGGVPVDNWAAFRREVTRRPEVPTDFRILRDGGELVRTVIPASREESGPDGEIRTIGQVGIFPPIPDLVYLPVRLTDAARIGFEDTRATTALILGFLRDLVTGNVSPRSLGSIVTIGEASGQAAAEGLEIFIRFMALFSVNLAILNLLPIPVLDGGHLMFLLIEAVRGRALSIEQRMRWSQVGFVIIMGIMLWALSNDFLRLFGL